MSCETRATGRMRHGERATKARREAETARVPRERERGGRRRSGEDETETETESDRIRKYTNGRSERDRNV